MEIPHSALNPDVLRAIIEEFVSREGTDYGDLQFSLEEKVAEVHQSLHNGRALVVFDPETESCNIVLRR